MTGSPQGSSPHLSGVVHFLKFVVGKEGWHVPCEVAPSEGWEFTVDKDSPLWNADPEMLTGAMCLHNIGDTPCWSEIEWMNIEVRFHAADGSYRQHLYKVEHEVAVDDAGNFFQGVKLEESSMSAHDMNELLDNIKRDSE
mgnify:CR=1 FL=1|tara:strand:+ start:511 stop:930 length:420 start_codon:yes stop_codon:yes gene_type:complete